MHVLAESSPCSRALALLTTLACLAPSLTPAAGQIAAHQNISTFKDSTRCMACHDTAAEEVMATTHWTWQHTNAITGQVLGKNKVINNYCIALPSNEPRCTSCHVGWGYSDKNFDFTDATKVDCLVCHDTTGEYKKFPAGSGFPVMDAPKEFPAGSGKIWPVVDLVKVAKNVGKTSRATCGACHFFGGGGDAVKHGDIDSSLYFPTREVDVHMGTNSLNFTCTSCHKTTHHQIPGTRYAKDHTDSKMCEGCHTTSPHTEAKLNQHTARVACQTCHIPEFARGSKATKMRWDWSTAGIKDANGKNMVLTNELGEVAYDTQKGNFTWERDVVPEYVWFNGGATYVTLNDVIEPDQIVTINKLHGSKEDAKSKIFPVKHFTAKQPYDVVNKRLVVPNLFPDNANDTNAYWKTYNWTNSIISGMAYIGETFEGEVGWVESEMYWIQNHMVAPKEKALRCSACHTESGGRLDFAALGYSSVQVAFLQSREPWESHTTRVQNYVGPGTCLACHPGKGDEVMDSAHFTWRTPNPRLAFPGGGSHGMIDRFCGLVGSSAMVNYYADLGEHNGTSACGKCHVAQGLPFPDPATGQFTQAQKDGLDCLICHATEGNYDMNGDAVYNETDKEATQRKLVTDAQTGRRSWYQDRSLRAASSVGPKVGVAACLRCHEHGQAAPDYKRGTPYHPEHDVHAAAGLLCTECHKVDHHKMARGSRVADMHAWELQNVEVDCSNCHGNKPHRSEVLAPYNEHAGYIACQTCHIPRVSGASRRIWYSTYGVTNGPEASVPALDPTTGMYEPYSVYGPDYSARPTYRWFNGDVSMLAEPLHDASAWDFRVATAQTPGAKIYPFRPIINGMVMDRRGFGYDPMFTPQFTMAAAMDAMQGPMKAMGFMRPEGMNERERAVLSQFPNLLAFDKETYVRTGNVKESVNVGVGRLAMLMSGQDAFGMTPAALSAAGATMWSGDLLGLDLPNNPADPTFVANSDPTRVTGSFVNLSHAVTKTNALTCLDCHGANSVLDFQALNYGPEKTARLTSLLSKVQFLPNTRDAAGLKLRASAIVGKKYQLQFSTSLDAQSWTPLGPVVSPLGPWCDYLVPDAELQKGSPLFFRVQEVQ